MAQLKMPIYDSRWAIDQSLFSPELVVNPGSNEVSKWILVPDLCLTATSKLYGLSQVIRGSPRLN